MTGMRLEDVPLDRIDPGPNVRATETLDADEELSASLDEAGLLQPIRVRPDGTRYRLVVGSRRYAAAMMAGLPTIPAIIDDRPPDPVRDSIDQLSENIQREDLNPMDIAVAMQRVMAADPTLSAARLGARLGKTKSWAYHILGLLRLDPEVQSKVRAGTIKLGHATPLVGAPPDEQVRLARLAEAGASSKAVEHATWPSTSSVSMHLGESILKVERDPDSTTHARIVVDAPEPLTTMYLDAVALRRLVKVLQSVASAIEVDHPVKRQRDRAKPTTYPATRRPAKRPRRPGVRGGPPCEVMP